MPRVLWSVKAVQRWQTDVTLTDVHRHHHHFGFLVWLLCRQGSHIGALHRRTVMGEQFAQGCYLSGIAS